MKANELMIGDWVKLNGDPLPQQVQELLFDSVTIQCWPHRYDDIFPIPLTSEILDKNFEMMENTYFWKISGRYMVDENFNFGIYYKNDFATWYSTVGLRELHYVHELQHLMKDCKINKEITL